MKLLSVAILLIGSLGMVLAQRQGGEQTSPAADRNSRQRVHQARLEKLFSGVGVTVHTDQLTMQGQTYRQLTVRWLNSDAPSENNAPSLTVVELVKRNGTLPRHRSLELTSNDILIAAVDKKSQLKWWTIVPDPRIARAEFPDSDGKLSGTHYSVSDVTLPVAFPDDPNIVELRFYRPVSNGTDFDLKLIATTTQ